jgi:uncharacterized protein YndB with AHSA1/START domain
MESAHTSHAIRIRHRFDVPVERLFRAWCDPVDLAHWAWGSLGRSAQAEVDFRVGGELRVETQRPDGETWSFSGRYTDIHPNRRIAHTLAWQAPMGYDPVPEHVEVEFHADGSDGSAVEFVHTGVPDEQSADAHARGWRNTLETLAAYLNRAGPKRAAPGEPDGVTGTSEQA